MAKILISGGSGLAGRAVSKLLLDNGHEVAWLSRTEGITGGIRQFKWDIGSKYLDERALEGADHLIHLAGAGIVERRWTKKYKQEIIDSRVKSAELLYETMLHGGYRLKSLVGAGAVGYYGTQATDHLFTENDPPGHDFLAEVCVQWEKSYQSFARAGIRTVTFRCGVVLSADAGAYRKMVAPFRLGLGAAVAGGQQYLPWIHIADLAALYVRAGIEGQMEGIYNATAPEIITNRQFSAALAASVHKPFLMPNVPAWALRLSLGEAATTLTSGQKVSCQKLLDSGFHFRFGKVEAALGDLARQ